MLKKILKRIVMFLPLRNIILFESAPDLSDNTKPVFDRLIRLNYNKKYKMIWFVSGCSDEYPKIYNVEYINVKSWIGKIKGTYYNYVAKCKISCNSFLTTYRSGQKSFYITHGTAFKSVRGYYCVPQNVDYILADGERTKEVVAYQMSADINKTFALGYPRNDVLTAPCKDISYLFPEKCYDKKVVWYPTYRQHKNETSVIPTNAIPFLYDAANAKRINDIAVQNNVLIILKPHFAQDVSNVKDFQLSNIKLIDDDFYLKNNISSYEFIAACDALLTDYSSIYYDYLLCDKPIGLIWEDYEIYKESVDFAVDMDYYMQAAVKIYNIDDFELFISNLVSGKDFLTKERQLISDWANYARDGRSTERVVDFIIENGKI